MQQDIIDLKQIDFENERKQCEVLLMFLKNYDFKNIKAQVLKILEINPNNQLARTIYNMGIEIESHVYGDYYTISFSSSPIEEYFFNNCGNIDIDLSLNMIILLSQKDYIDASIDSCVLAIIKNIENLNLDKNTLANFYISIINIAKKGNVILSSIEKDLKKSKFGGLKTFILTDNEYLASSVDGIRSDIKRLKKQLTKSKNNFQKAVIKCINQTQVITEDVKKKLKLNLYREKIIQWSITGVIFIIIMIVYFVFAF